MKPSELTYITQDIINKGTFNVTSPEMMEEARRYNMDVVTNAARRNRMVAATGIWFVVQIILVIASVCMSLSLATLSDWSFREMGEFRMITSVARVALMVLGLLIYLGAFGYYVIFRFQRSPLIVFICSVPLALTTFLGVLVIIINYIVALVNEKKEKKFSEEAGYPAFVRLAVTTVEGDAKSVLDLTYDSIRERTRHRRSDDEEFL